MDLMYLAGVVRPKINQAITNLQAIADAGEISDHPEIAKTAMVTKHILGGIFQYGPPPIVSLKSGLGLSNVEMVQLEDEFSLDFKVKLAYSNLWFFTVSIGKFVEDDGSDHQKAVVDGRVLAKFIEAHQSKDESLWSRIDAIRFGRGDPKLEIAYYHEGSANFIVLSLGDRPEYKCIIDRNLDIFVAFIKAHLKLNDYDRYVSKTE